MGKFSSIFVRSMDLLETLIKCRSVLRGRRGGGATGFISIDWFVNINTGLLHNNAAQNEFMMILVTNLSPSFLSN